MLVFYKLNTAICKSEIFKSTVWKLAIYIFFDCTYQRVSYVLKSRCRNVCCVIRKNCCLVRVNAKRISLSIYSGFDLSETCTSCYVESYVCAILVLSKRHILTCCRIIEVTYISKSNLCFFIDILCTLDISNKEVLDNRVVHTAKESDDLIGRIDHREAAWW